MISPSVNITYRLIMRIVVQRVKNASVSIDNVLSSSIGPGLVLLAGVAKGDSHADVQYLVEKVSGLRIFPDASGKMNLSVRETGGAVMIISNFTVYADTTKGKRPSFDRAAAPEDARPLYDYFVEQMKQTGIPVVTGVFQARMEVTIQNSGPITLILESR
jgi:D-tyrosyl-tRNA(Tyr) deacylase